VSPAAALFLYVLVALGGLGLFLAMPRLGRRSALPGGMIGLGAVFGLIALFATSISGEPESRGYFYFFAAVAVLAAGRVVTHPKPVYSAIYVVVLVIAVAVLLVLQQAEFLAVALLIIYAGAILVTYLFVIMLAQQPGSPVHDCQAREPFAAMLAGFVLLGAITGTIAASSGAAAVESSAAVPVANFESHTVAIGAAVMTKYVVVLEIAGVLLLISMIGAIALSKKRVPSEAIRMPRAPLGEVGKEVEPF